MYMCIIYIYIYIVYLYIPTKTSERFTRRWFDA